MGNSNPTTGTTVPQFAGMVSFFSGLAGLGLALLQVEQQESASTLQKEWRKEDQTQCILADIAETDHRLVVKDHLAEIGDSVRALADRVDPPPLVLATVVRDKRLPITTRSPRLQSTSHNERKIDASGIELIAATDQPLIDVTATWIVDGVIKAVSLSSGVLATGNEIPLERFPVFAPKTTTVGMLHIEFSNSIGFHGTVDHPFQIKSCADHIHVTIEPHTYQSWTGPPHSVLTN